MRRAVWRKVPLPLCDDMLRLIILHLPDWMPGEVASSLGAAVLPRTNL